MATRLVLATAAISAAALAAGPRGVGRPGADSAYRELAAAHYARVEDELGRADVSGLSRAQREARARALGALRAYRERGEFGISDDLGTVRSPTFVDADGRRCAVAELLHASGEDALVARVARTANGAWIADLEGDAEFAAWLDRSGLGFAEAARVQVPAWTRRQNQPPVQDRRTSTQGSGTGDDGASSSSSSSGPSDAGAGGGSSSGTGTGGASSGAGGRAAGGSAGTGSGEPAGDDAGRGGRDGAGADASSWSVWWEFSKLDYVRATPLAPGEADFVADGKSRRERALATFEAALGDADAAVRGAAAVAYGRVAGASAVEKLLPLLGDADGSVRERAVLALGATGSRRGADELLRLAESGSAAPDARSLAIVSLAVARRYGLDASFDAPLAKLVDASKKRDLDALATGALVHRILTPGTELDRVALRLAADVNAPSGPRTRAIESLGARDDRRAASALRGVVGDRHVEFRRSAAVALGDMRGDVAVAQMKTAYELETEPFTRGLLLVSLGRAGGLPALDFLRDELAEGPVAMRPWAALGLGIVAHGANDVEARAALRAADLGPDAHGAVWIAQGLAQDEGAVPALAAALAAAQSPAERAHAATALALVGTDAAHAALAAALPRESSEYARVIIAWGLGTLGREADAAALLDTVERIEDAGLSGVASVALGLHGSAACLDGALRRASDLSLGGAARAAAVEASGLLLTRRPGLVLHEVSRATNFAVMPRWLRAALMVTL